MISKIIRMLVPLKYPYLLLPASILYAIFTCLLPTIALFTVNQEWTFYLGFLGFYYKAWRLFLVFCGLPSLACTLVLILFIPESPKYSFSQGDEDETLKILQQIYRMNTGNVIQNFEVKGLIKDGEFGESSRSNSGNFFKFMWSQSVPLFKGSHLRNILTACFMQFSVCLTSNGFWTFLPEILNKVSLWMQSSRGPATVCEIYYNPMNETRNLTDLNPICLSKLEFGTFVYIYELGILFAIAYAVMSLAINRTGKLVIIVAISLICGLSAFLLIFLRIPSSISYLYIIMMVAGLTLSVVNASTVELFPTNMRLEINFTSFVLIVVKFIYFRAMAICISMMIGRLGSSVGSIIIGLVIDKHCDLTFVMPTVLLGVTAVLAFTIPNISKRVR